MFFEGREVNILKSLRVKEFASQDVQVFLNTEHVGRIIDQALNSKHHTFQIVDNQNNYIGCFSLNQMKKLVLDKDLLDSLLIAEDLAVPGISLDYEGNLEQAMKIFGREDVSEITLLKGTKFAGVIKRKDVIEAYNHEIIKKEAAEGIAQKLKFSPQSKSFDISGGYKIMEIQAPPSFVDKSLKDLNLKAKRRIDILLIKRKYPPMTIPIPSANEVIKKGDTLVLAGVAENIVDVLKNGTS